MRQLHPRGAASTGITVDRDGAMLGPDCVLVRRTVQGYRCVGSGEAAALQEFLFAGGVEPDWLFGQCRRIAKALDGQEIALAQILGLRIPIEDLDSRQLSRLARAAPFVKANFNPGQPRVPAGEPGGGEWTTGGGADEPTTVPPRAERDASGSSQPGGSSEPSLIPAQMTIPWELPTNIPWKIPVPPTEIAPIPFDLPGAERKLPPLPTNPFPRDPDCAEEWTAAYDYCNKMKSEGKFRPGYSGPGKGHPELPPGTGLGEMRREPHGMSTIDDELTQEEIDRQFQLWRTDPIKFWEVTNKRVEERPDGPNGYFGRHQAWDRLGRLDLALADLDKSLSLEDRSVTHDARGKTLRGLGRYRAAIDAYNRAEQLEPIEWGGGFGPLFRADCYAHLGEEAAALADCETMPDDHWTPGMFGLPAGNKQDVAAELCRRAAAARARRWG
jgi:hypothetical protein